MRDVFGERERDKEALGEDGQNLPEVGYIRHCTRTSTSTSTSAIR